MCAWVPGVWEGGPTRHTTQKAMYAAAHVPRMDVDPDTVAAIAVEAWVMARARSLIALTPSLGQEQAIEQALVDLRRKRPALGGALRALNAKDFLA